MLPLTFQFLIAMVAHAVNERMARRLDYLQEEVRVLKEALRAATGKSRIAFTDEQRRRLAIKGKALTPEERESCCQLVRPSTILKWFRQLAAKKYDSSRVRKPGRPRKADEIRDLVLRIARENPGWGYTKIRDALRGLGLEIGRTTVANMLAESGLEPDEGFLRHATHLIHDRDPLFTTAWKALLKSSGVKAVPIPAMSPNCNPWAERFVRTAREECLSHFVIFGERHLRVLLREFLVHYLTERFHQGLDGKLIRPPPTPANSNADAEADGIRCRSRLGGVLNYYHRHAA